MTDEAVVPTAPSKPVYGVMDFQAQFVVPMSKNPPITPIDGSIYIDTDDGRIYAWAEGAWRASRISAVQGTGVVFTQDELGVTTVSVAPPEVMDLVLESPWTSTAEQPHRIRTASGVVQLRGQVQAPGPLGKPITVLPSGWRPSSPILAICVAGSSQQNVEINPDGTVTPVNGTGSPTWLGGITFVADGD